MDRNTNDNSKSTDDGEGASGGNGRASPRRRRSGDALRLQDVLLLGRDELLGGSSASLDAVDTSPRGGQRRRRRLRSRQASEDLLSMTHDLNDAGDGRTDEDSTAASERQRPGSETGGEEGMGARDVLQGGLPPPPLASFHFGGDPRRQQPMDRDRMAEILSAALVISAGEFGDDGQVEEKNYRTRRDHFDDDKFPPQ